jgi:hypothetical protein
MGHRKNTSHKFLNNTNSNTMDNTINSAQSANQCDRAVSDGERLFFLLFPDLADVANAYDRLMTKNAYEQAATQLLEPVRQRADNWQDTAKQYARDCENRDAQMREIVKYLGVEVFICDDGSISPDPLFAKVPVLVRDMALVKGQVWMALMFLSSCVETGICHEVSPEQLITAAVGTIRKQKAELEAAEQRFFALIGQLNQRNETIVGLTTQMSQEQKAYRNLENDLQKAKEERDALREREASMAKNMMDAQRAMVSQGITADDACIDATTPGEWDLVAALRAKDPSMTALDPITPQPPPPSALYESMQPPPPSGEFQCDKCGHQCCTQNQLDEHRAECV